MTSDQEIFKDLFRADRLRDRGIDHVRLDAWNDEALGDPSIEPYLTLGVHTVAITIPEDEEDGFVLMDSDDRGVMKVYFDPESQSAKVGIWVREARGGDKCVGSRGLIAYGLTAKALEIIKRYPWIKYLGSRVSSTNQHGQAYSNRLFDVWGHEKEALIDGNTKSPFYGKWVDWYHYREKIHRVQDNLGEWGDELFS